MVEGKVFSDMQLKTAQATYEAATAQVAQAKAALGSSQINADFSLIKAPVSGAEENSRILIYGQNYIYPIRTL